MWNIEDKKEAKKNNEQRNQVIYTLIALSTILFPVLFVALAYGVGLVLENWLLHPIYSPFSNEVRLELLFQVKKFIAK